MNRYTKQKIITALIGVCCILAMSYAAMIYFGEFKYKKYTDESAGFSIMHPQHWAYSPNKDGANVIFYTPRENDYDTFAENVNIVVQDLSRNPMKLNQYTELIIKQMVAVFGENMEIVESNGAYLSRRIGHKFVFIGKGTYPLKMMIYWTIKGEIAYQVTYTARPDTFTFYLKDIEKMIKSFKILG